MAGRAWLRSASLGVSLPRPKGRDNDTYTVHPVWADYEPGKVAASFGGWVSSGFNNTLDDKIFTIEKRIDENKKKYDEAEENEKWNKRLRTEAMHGRKACRDLKVRIKALNKEFATELLRVNESQLVESSLWRGLLELSSMVEDPKFLSSRDNSLRLVLKVLKADDDKFGSGDRYAHVEERIKLAIIGRWGEDGLKKL
ncbi:hypothetical protein FOXYSP1_15584 [Fusarium oxysporum f. sp. phaseoli]